MNLLPSFSDLLKILLIFLITGFGIFLLSILMLNVIGIGIFLNTGYSMCAYEDPLLEFLPINDDKCSWVPINVLVINPYIDRNNLKIGENVCYFRNTDIVCHRIFDRRIDERGKVIYYIAGLHPNSLKEWVEADKIYGVVIDKFPRGMGGPFLIAMFLFSDPLSIYIKLNKGYYI